MQKTPIDYPVWTYAVIAGIAMLGGLVARLQYMIGHASHCWKCATVRICVEMLTSAFCGILVFWICEAVALPLLMTCALAGICGHMGSRALFLAERILVRKLNQYSDEGSEEEKL